MKRIISLFLIALMCLGLLAAVVPESRADASPVKKGSRTITSAGELNVFDTVTFGSYPTGSYLEYQEIRWIVLSKSENKVVLLARDLLDSCPFHRTEGWVTWQFCDLNDWLNETFMNTAFRSAEQTLISGNITIPSVEEARSLPRELLYPAFTPYAVSRGGDSQQGIWWLRDRNQETNLGNGVRANVGSVVRKGEILEAYYKVTFHGKGVRPMLEIDFDRLEEYAGWSRKEDSKALELLDRTSSDDIRLYDIVSFGNYPQSYYGSPEPIRWVVIEKNGDRIKLLSETALDWQSYQYPYGVVSWPLCTLNGWLADSFRNAAFSQEEQSVLRNTVTLLSAEEARDLPTDLRITRSSQYAVSQGAASSVCIWWLKDTMMSNNFWCASTVLGDGEVVDDYFGVAGKKAVRPVIEIDLSVPAH